MRRIKLVRYLSHASWVKISETYVRDFLKSIQKHWSEEEREKTIDAIAKLFSLYAQENMRDPFGGWGGQEIKQAKH